MDEASFLQGWVLCNEYSILNLFLCGKPNSYGKLYINKLIYKYYFLLCNCLVSQGLPCFSSTTLVVMGVHGKHKNTIFFNIGVCKMFDKSSFLGNGTFFRLKFGIQICTNVIQTKGQVMLFSVFSPLTTWSM